MELQQLRTLIHVAELGSLSKASERLAIAQPALGRQMQMLEAELGVPLFIRHGRGMVLTPLGSKLLEPARSVLDTIDSMRELASRAQAGRPSGTVRFGMTPTVAEIMTLPLAKAVADECPEISLCLSTAFSGHLLDWLQRGEIDCAVTYELNGGDATLRTRPILRESLFLFGTVESGLTPEEDEVRFLSLTSRRLALPSRRHGLRRILDRYAEAAGITLTPVIEADSLSALVQLARAGLGMTILPLPPIYDLIRSGSLVAAKLIDPHPTRLVTLAFRADRDIAPAVRQISQRFEAIAHSLIEQGMWAGEISR